MLCNSLARFNAVTPPNHDHLSSSTHTSSCVSLCPRAGLVGYIQIIARHTYAIRKTSSYFLGLVEVSADMKTGRDEWKIPVTKMANSTYNPIRSMVESMTLTPNPDKPMITLSVGDPTVFGNLPPPESCEKAVIDCLRQRTFNGYTPSVGYDSARDAIASYVSTASAPVTAKDIVLANGCSGALDLCISCLAEPGQNILIPRPGFSLYKTLAESLGVQVRQYNLLPDRSWEVDLDHLDGLMDANTRAVVVCNPSNPCGSVYSKEHLLDIIQRVGRTRLPIIDDAVYEHFVFSGHKYHSLASLSQDVPVLSCSGLTKRFMVPGWRLGWIVLNDRHGALSEVREGLAKLSQRILGPNSLIQAAVPDILKKTPESFFLDSLSYIENNARIFFKSLGETPGLRPVMPQGAMYMMVGVAMECFPGFTSDVDFTERLVTEQSVFCLPATCFQYPNYFRLVLTVPTEMATEACSRIRTFCEHHFSLPGNLVNGFD